MTGAHSQKTIVVPSAVKSALKAKYPQTKNVKWEKEKGNYEANWGGPSGEDMSVQFTPSGEFVEAVKAISISDLPAAVAPYVRSHFNGAPIKEAGKVVDAKGKQTYEVEIKGKDLIFGLDGKYVGLD